MNPRTDDEVVRDGIRAIQDRLGLVDSLRFMRLVGRRSGDYARDRGSFLSGKDFEQELEEFLVLLDSGVNFDPLDHSASAPTEVSVPSVATGSIR